MPEFRQNRASKEWVIIAPGRGKRPSDFAREQFKRELPPPHKDDCPFCTGNENMTPPPVYIIPDKDNWSLRVVPNKFAALQADLTPTRTFVGNFLAAKGFGIAEVVVESPLHNKTMADMDPDDIVPILTAYKERHREISRNDQINLITIFRNYGARAGTSLEHPHSQIIATPIVPPHVRYPIEQAMLHYDKYGTCVYCDLLDDELHQKERIIIESDHFVAFCPWAARTPFEARIYPRRHEASFVSINQLEINDLANVLRNLLYKISKALENPDFNYVIHSSPIGDEDTRYLHWYIAVIPKITTSAGFEIGSGIYINTVAPEDSAKILREIK